MKSIRVMVVSMPTVLLAWTVFAGEAPREEPQQGSVTPSVLLSQDPPDGGQGCQNLSLLEPFSDAREPTAQTQPGPPCVNCPRLDPCDSGCTINLSSCQPVDYGAPSCRIRSGPCNVCPSGTTMHYDECACTGGCPDVKRNLHCR